MRSFASKSIALLSALVLSAGLSACAVSGPAAIQASNGAAQAIGSVEFPEIEGAENLRAKFGAALTRSFEARSVRIEKSAPYIADFALSVREAQAGIAKSVDPDSGIDWQSVPRENKFLDICKAKRLRGSLIVFERKNGSIVYQGESEADGCAFEQEDFDSMAAQLVADAVK